MTFPKHIIYLLFFTSAAVVAQPGTETEEEKEEKELNSESVTVVKPYSPTISDAFKLRSKPQLSDTTQIEKRQLQYQINSVPVASTFTPAKGRLSNLKRARRPNFYDNYARVGFGRYANILAEFAGSFEVDRDADFGVFLNHFSTQGGIDEAVLDDSFYDTSLDLSYNYRSRDFNWDIGAGGRHRLVNWYGADRDLFGGIDADDVDTAINYMSYGVDTQIEFFDMIVDEVSLDLNGMTSDYDATEFRVSAGTAISFDVLEEEIALNLGADYLTGSFEEQTDQLFTPEYSYASFNATPSINLYGDKYAVNLGVNLNYLTDLENSEGAFNIYPAIDASYQLLDDKIAAYAMLGGGLDLNSLHSITNDNPFIAPSIVVAPTDRAIDAQLGFKGRISSLISYKLFGGYKNEEGRLLYVKSGRTPSLDRPYDYRNVFLPYYTDLTTISVGGGLSFDFSDNVHLMLDATYFAYDVNDVLLGDTPSQLPQFNIESLLNYQITENWTAGAMLYVVGEREVVSLDQDVQTLDPFVDLNIDVTYKINAQLSAFLRGNNLTGGSYEYYLDYPVQSLQVMGGAVYKFDF